MESVIETLRWVRKLIDDGLTINQLRRKVEKALQDMKFYNKCKKQYKGR